MKNKKIALLTISTILAIGVVVTGCSKDVEPAQSDPIVESDPIIDIIEPEKDEDINSEEDLSDRDADSKFLLTMEADNVFTYAILPAEGTVYQTGMPYTVDRLNKNGEWERVKLDMMFTMQIVIVDSENPFYQTVDMTDMEPGTYLISKSILDENGEVVDELGSIEITVHNLTK